MPKYTVVIRVSQVFELEDVEADSPTSAEERARELVDTLSEEELDASSRGSIEDIIEVRDHTEEFFDG